MLRQKFQTQVRRQGHLILGGASAHVLRTLCITIFGHTNNRSFFFHFSMYFLVFHRMSQNSFDSLSSGTCDEVVVITLQYSTWVTSYHEHEILCPEPSASDEKFYLGNSRYPYR